MPNEIDHRLASTQLTMNLNSGGELLNPFLFGFKMSTNVIRDPKHHPVYYKSPRHVALRYQTSQQWHVEITCLALSSPYVSLDQAQGLTLHPPQ